MVDEEWAKTVRTAPVMSGGGSVVLVRKVIQERLDLRPMTCSTFSNGAFREIEGTGAGRDQPVAPT